MSIDQQRVEAVRQRVRDHDAKTQQMQGRRQSLQEQEARYVADLQAAGITPEELPERIAQSEAIADSKLTELEQTLTAHGA